MAAPTVRADYRTTVRDFNSNSHAVQYPDTVEAGDKITCVVSEGWTGAVTFPAGWVRLLYTSYVQLGCACGYLIADGTETGTFQVGIVDATWISAITFAVVDSEVPEISATSKAGGSSPNSPNFTPSGGALDYLWAAVVSADDGRNVDNYPSNMTTGPQLYVHGGFAGSPTTGIDFHDVNAASFDPNNFGLNAATEHISYTLAFPPGAAAAAPGNSGSHRKGPLNKPTGKPLGKGKRRAPDQPATGNGVLSPTFEWID